jgi:hypothetical protein
MLKVTKKDYQSKSKQFDSNTWDESHDITLELAKTTVNSLSPSSPTTFECSVFFRVADKKSSRHLGLVYFWQTEFQVVEENLLVVGRR